jgi:hypothetical protein
MLTNYYFNQEQIDSIFKDVNFEYEETVSLCHECYNHVPAFKYEKDGKLRLRKYCSTHGKFDYVIENDYEFYKSLVCSYNSIRFNRAVMIEASDKCNLDCPHCYHIPNNKLKDPAQELMLNQIGQIDFSFSQKTQDPWALLLAGAEATMRKDFGSLIANAKSKYSRLGRVGVLTNGIRFNDEAFVKDAKEGGLDMSMVGLNHPTYNHSAVIRAKQETAIDNLFANDIEMQYISYTLEDLDHLDDVLKEILSNRWRPNNFRIRYGSDIGRNPGQERIFLSDLYKRVVEWCDINDKTLTWWPDADNNIYHIMVNIEGQNIRLIQWCDEYDIDMESLRAGPWCNFVPNGITNFLNQIIRRNAFKNKGLLLQDTPPLRYRIDPYPDKTKLDLTKLV